MYANSLSSRGKGLEIAIVKISINTQSAILSGFVKVIDYLRERKTRGEQVEGRTVIMTAAIWQFSLGYSEGKTEE